MEKLQKLSVFRQVDDEESDDFFLKIPALSIERKLTDKKGFLIYGISLLTYVSFLVCYFTNIQNGAIECSQVDNFRGCIQSREMPLQRLPVFITTVILTSALSMFVLFALSRAPSTTTWTILYNTVIVFGTLAYVAWCAFLPRDNPNWNIRQNPKLILPIILTLLAVTSIFLPCIFHKVLKSVNPLLQEAAKTLFSVPALFVSVLMVMSFQAIVLGGAALIAAPMVMSLLTNRINSLVIFLLIMTIIMTFWTMQILSGFQTIMIAQSISSFYFASFRLYTESPVMKSFRNTARFHIGTVAFAAMSHPILATVKFLLQCYQSPYLESLNIKNGFIITALHSQPFLESARRARDLLEANDLISVKQSSDVMVWLIRIHLLVYSTVMAYAFLVYSNDISVTMIVCLSVNCIVIFVLLDTFESTVYTLLLCFCEDKFINQDKKRGYYYMTTYLDDIFNSAKQDRYKKNLIFGQRAIMTRNYMVFV